EKDGHRDNEGHPASTRVNRPSGARDVFNQISTAGYEASGMNLRSKETAMKSAGNLWAVAYDEPNRAAEVRAELQALEERQFLLVEDMAVVVREADGSFRLDRERFPFVGNIAGCSLVGFLAGLVVLAPFTGAAIGAAVGSAGSAIAARV